jgi:ribosomal protein L32
MLADKGLPSVSPKAAFGRSHFDTPSHEWMDEESGTAYGPGTKWQRRFSQLEAIDPSFHAFLEGRGYNSHHLDRIPPASRAAEIRKISPLVAARLFFLREQVPAQRKSRSRSRKRLTLYAEKSSGLVSILDSLGEYFRHEQIAAPFSAEPPGSFVVDEDSPAELVNAVGRSLNAGALVIVDGDDDSQGLGVLRGRRLRLCYLLVAYYGAMPRLARPVSLRRILAETRFETRDPVQLSLA